MLKRVVFVVSLRCLLILVTLRSVSTADVPSGAAIVMGYKLKNKDSILFTRLQQNESEVLANMLSRGTSVQDFFLWRICRRVDIESHLYVDRVLTSKCMRPIAYFILVCRAYCQV
jgi:hypothetical protein